MPEGKFRTIKKIIDDNCTYFYGDGFDKTTNNLVKKLCSKGWSIYQKYTDKNHNNTEVTFIMVKDVNPEEEYELNKKELLLE